MQATTESNQSTREERQQLIDDMETMSEPRCIVERLLEAQKNLTHIVKDASNDFAKYKYPKADSYIAACRTALISADLLLKRSFAFDRSDMTVAVSFKLYDPESGECMHDVVVFPVVVRAGMPEDKATSASVTTATAYYLQGLFMLPRVDSVPEIDDIDDTKFDPAVDAAMKKLAKASTLSVSRVQGLVAQRASEAGVPITVEFVSTLIENAKTKKGE